MAAEPVEDVGADLGHPEQPAKAPERAVWKWVASPTADITAPCISLEATVSARRHATLLTAAWRLLQAKANWQDDPVRWCTTAQMVLGKAGWRTRFSTTWATACCPAETSPRASK